jgi:hypothetical protein
VKKPRDMVLDLSNAKVLSTLIHPIPRPAPTPAQPGVHHFDVPRWRPVTLNELFAAGNPMAVARKKRADREIVATYAALAGIPQATRKRRVSLAITLAGRMKQCDPDAFHKSLNDALVACRMLVDDSPQWCEIGPVVQVGGEEKSTRITLEDI